MVFSLDSVITAVGTVDEIWVMVAAVMIAIGLMLVFAGTISSFVDEHPTVKMLALTFLVLIGATLIADGFDQKVPKGYVYGPMAFSILVEVLNLRVRSRKARWRQQGAGATAALPVLEPVHLRPVFVKSSQGQGPPSAEMPAGSERVRSGVDPA